MRLTIENDKELQYFTKVAEELSFNEAISEDAHEWLMVLVEEIERYEEEHYPME